MTPSKAVRFQQPNATNTVHVKSYLPYGSSIWYTSREYRSFNLNETRELLSGPPALRKETRERSLRMNNVRQLVIEAQTIQFKGAATEETKSQDKTQWLADFYKRHSEPFVAEARQRGIENDLELLNMKLKDASSAMLKRSTLFKKLTVTAKDKNTTNNARWSETRPGVMKVGLVGQCAGACKDQAPIAVKSSTYLRRELCKDFDLNKSLIGRPWEESETRIKPIERKWSSEEEKRRWSAVPCQTNTKRSLLKRDRPLKDIQRSARRRPSLSC